MEDLLNAVKELSGDDLKKDGIPKKGALVALLELHESDLSYEELVELIEPESNDEEIEDVTVENLYTSPICLPDGTNIPVGGSAVVAGFDEDHGVIKQWIAKKVIKVS